MSNLPTDPRHRLFVDYLLGGDCKATAYKRAGFTAKNTAVASACANRLLKNAKVAAYREKREKELNQERFATLEERMEECTKVIRDPLYEPNPLLFKAIDALNKMQGVGNPQADAMGSLAAAIANMGSGDGWEDDKM